MSMIAPPSVELEVENRATDGVGLNVGERLRMKTCRESDPRRSAEIGGS
jgi:hypothetical protein